MTLRALLRVGSALVLPLFALHNGLWILHGLRHGGVLYDAASSSLGRVDRFVFSAVFTLLPLLVLGLGAGLDRTRWTTRLGMGLAALASAAALVGSVGLTVQGEPPAFAFPTACLAVFAAAMVVGVEALRSGRLSRTSAVALIAFGALTMPLAWAVPAVLGGWLPPYALDEAHFLFAGAAWWRVGRGVPPAEAPAGAVPA